MSEHDPTICELCHKALGFDETQAHQCKVWCQEKEWATEHLHEPNEPNT